MEMSTLEEQELYSRLVERSKRFVKEPQDDFTEHDWISERVSDLYCHHMVLDLWKPRIIKTSLSNTAKGVSTK
jgi:hypothetical protein